MNRDSLADTLLTTEGQPAYPGMPFQHQLAPRWRTVFQRSAPGTPDGKPDGGR